MDKNKIVGYVILEKTSHLSLVGTRDRWNWATAMMDAEERAIRTKNLITVYEERENGTLIPIKEFWCECTLNSKNIIERESKQ